MKRFKNFFNQKKKELTVEAFDNIMDSKKEELKDIVVEHRTEVAFAAGVVAGLLVLGCISKMRHSSSDPQLIYLTIINN